MPSPMWRQQPKGAGRPPDPHRAHRHREDGLFPSTYRVKWDIVGDPKVSILIPNKDHTDDLEKCLHSIWTKTSWENFEVIVIENNSTEPATFTYYKEARQRYDGLQVVNYPQKASTSPASTTLADSTPAGIICCC